MLLLFAQHLHLIVSFHSLKGQYAKVCRIHYTPNWTGSLSFIEPTLNLTGQLNIVPFILCKRMFCLSVATGWVEKNAHNYFKVSFHFFQFCFYQKLVSLLLQSEGEKAPFLIGIIGAFFSSVKKIVLLLHQLWMAKLLSFYDLLLIPMLGTCWTSRLPSSLPPLGGALTVFRPAGFLLANSTS